MDFNNLSAFNDLPQIHYFEDGSINTQQWPYPDQFEVESLGRSVVPNKSYVLSDFDLHLDTGHSNMPPMDRFVHGPDQPPFYSGMRTTDLHISSTYDANASIYNRQGSPRLSERSSIGGGTLSTCHSDEYSHDHRAHMIESPEMSQGYFPQGSYNNYATQSPELPPGGGCNLGQIQHFQDLAMELEAVHSEIDGEGESDHEEDHIVCRRSGMPYTPISVSEDEGLGESIRDSVSLYDEEADPEYEPRSRSSPKTSRSKRPVNGRRSSHSRKQSNAASGARVTKPKNRKAANPHAARPFPCPLACYGCVSTFTSKNEWKRHVSTQHIKLGYWRCDMCPPSADPNNPSYNDFNRKDLFTQHLRRMHTHHPLSIAATQSSPTSTFSSKQEGGLSDETVATHQHRCYLHLRTPPPQSNCLFCPRVFSGDGSWEERIEHVGAHFERERKSGVKSSTPDTWNADPILRDWLMQEGLVEHDLSTGWRIGDGRPLKEAS
jgi:hypothetical protein